MNRSPIEWCDFTWNPITGCLHGCPYCYAKPAAILHARGERQDLMNGLHVAGEKSTFPAAFEPTIYPHRFNDPSKVKTPSVIFVCSMADMLGAWVPKIWLDQVFAGMKAADYHVYIILTKNPQGALSYLRSIDRTKLPSHLIVGTSITGALDEAESLRLVDLVNLKRYVGTVLSLEPYTQRIPFAELRGIIEATEVEWLIIGGRSRANRLSGFVPPRDWIDDAVEVCDACCCPLFLKENAGLIQGEECEWHPMIRKYIHTLPG